MPRGDKDLLEKLGESQIRLEMNVVELRKVQDKIADSNEGMQNAVKSFNDNFILHAKLLEEKIDSTRNGCQKINYEEKEKLWKMLTIVLMILLLVLGIKEFGPDIAKAIIGLV